MEEVFSIWKIIRGGSLMSLGKSTVIIKIGALLLIGLFILIIYVSNPKIFTGLWQVLISGNMQETIEYIKSFGSLAMIVSFFLGVFVNLIGFPPAVIFSAANALVFGIFQGILLSWIAETVGVTLSFLLLRFLFRDVAEKIIAQHASLKRIDSFSGKDGFKVMLIARTLPYFPSGVLNALGAVSQITLFDYVLSSLIGKLPSTALEAMIGHDALTAGENPKRLLVGVSVTVILIVGYWLYNNRKKKVKVKFTSSCRISNMNDEENSIAIDEKAKQIEGDKVKKL